MPLKLILSLALLHGVATVSVHPPEKATTIQLIIECDDGFYANSTRSVQKLNRFVIIDLPKFEACHLYVAGYDLKGKFIKSQIEDFFTAS